MLQLRIPEKGIGSRRLILMPLSLIPAVLILSLIFTRCSKDQVVVLPTETDVHFLGHRGGGNVDYNTKYVENTISSIQDGLKTMNGVEVDLQMSLDGTIWMFHDPDLSRTACQTNFRRSIVLMKDVDIAKQKLCIGKNQDRIYKLEELANLWKSNAAGFYLSMEVKLDFPADTMNNKLIGGEAAYLSRFADRLAALFPEVKFPGKLMIEVYDARFCTKMHALVPGIQVCLLKEVSFQQQINDAIALGYDGVSCIFDEPGLTAAEVQRARDRGLIVQLWTPNSKAELTKALGYHPHFIQTDNLDAINLLNLKVNP